MSFVLSIGSVADRDRGLVPGGVLLLALQADGHELLMFLLLSVRMVPAAAVVVPIFMMYNALGWNKTLHGMLLFYAMFSIPFSLWILKGFLDGVSMRYDETALVNGGSRLHIIFRVVLPQVKPGLVAAAIFNLIFVWNEFLFNYILGGKGTTMIPVMLATGVNQGGSVDWTFIASLSFIYMLPPIVAIFFFQQLPAGRHDLRHRPRRGVAMDDLRAPSPIRQRMPFAAQVQGILIAVMLIGLVLIAQRQSLTLYRDRPAALDRRRVSADRVR